MSPQEWTLIGFAALGVLVVIVGIAMILEGINGVSATEDNNSLVGFGFAVAIVGVAVVALFGIGAGWDLSHVSDDEFAQAQVQQLDQDKETLEEAELWLASGKISTDKAVEQLTRQIEDLRGSIHTREAEFRASEKAKEAEESQILIDAKNDRQQKEVSDLFSGTGTTAEGK